MNYSCDNKAPTLMAQMPNRVGNISKMPPKGNTGVTAVTNTKHGVSQPKGSQSAPNAGGSITGRHQPVSVSRPKEAYGANDGYRAKSVNNYKG